MGLPWVVKPGAEKSKSSLRVWIPLAIALFVMLGSVVMLLVFDRFQKRDERDAFADLARINASFMERTRLPRTAQMAERLSEVIGAQVFFYEPANDRILGSPDATLPEPAQSLREDGEVAELPDGRMMVRVTDEVGVQMIFLKQPQFTGLADLGSEAWSAIGLFWLLSLGLGLGLSLWVSAPLQSLVRALPKVGTNEDLPALPVKRGDEIGSLARVLHATHESLSEEREKRRQAERLAMLGGMATGIAHEIRNPAAAIRLHTELMDASDAKGLSQSRELILNEAQRLEGLVSQWLHLSRPEPPKTSAMDLGALLTEVKAVMEPQAKHMNVVIGLEEFEGDMLVQADRHRMHQVFSNLLMNAIQAMPSGGEVSVTVAEEGDCVSVTVSDQGEGFSEAALERAGEAFYSEREGGLGIGLAVAVEICRAHDGSLELGNDESGGASIRVELPKPKSQNESSA